MRFHRTMKPTRQTPRGIAAFLIFALSVLCAEAAPASHKKYFVYVGTYTAEAGSTSKGIYAYRFDSDTGELTSIGVAAETTNPSFLAVHPNHRFLYAVNETGNYQGQKSGAVSAFSIDHATGKLTLLNEVASKGADPCYITVDKTGKYVLVANYTGGSVAVFPVLEDGRLGEASAFIQHTGHGADPERQEGPHAHSIDLSPDERFAIVDDLGLDETLVYRFDSAKGSLTLNDPQIYTTLAKADPGAGPGTLLSIPTASSPMSSTKSSPRFRSSATTDPPESCAGCKLFRRIRKTSPRTTMTLRFRSIPPASSSMPRTAAMTASPYSPSTQTKGR